MRLLFLTALVVCSAVAQKHELGLTLGRISGPDRSIANSGDLSLNSGMAMQVNYGYRFYRNPIVGISTELHFLANGQRTIDSGNAAVTRDLATLFVTPGIRVKLLPDGRFQPYGVIGGGYALYEQSFFRIDGGDNQAGRFIHRGAVMYGGGVDIPLWRFIGARFEVRDFYSGNPNFNVNVNGSGQHNVVFGGGFTIRWGGQEN
ncbi:MAG: hypothetical protein H7039_13505 [Bryobacteraceae bacterium]|nr:hypothetical protein [Bryobacteraceae bacterium]